MTAPCLSAARLSQNTGPKPTTQERAGRVTFQAGGKTVDVKEDAEPPAPDTFDASGTVTTDPEGGKLPYP